MNSLASQDEDKGHQQSLRPRGTAQIRSFLLLTLVPFPARSWGSNSSLAILVKSGILVKATSLSLSMGGGRSPLH